MLAVELALTGRLCELAVQASSLAEYRTRVLETLHVHLAFDAALFHELSPRVPLSSAAVIGIEAAVLDANSNHWDETAVRLDPLLEVALAQGGVATDREAFPNGTRSRREWERWVAKPFGMQSLLAGHLVRHGRVISVIALMRRRKPFSKTERMWLGTLLPCLTLGDAYWQFAGQQRFAGMLAQPVCRDQRLTARQRQIVEAVALGRTNRQIADGLGISPHTVRNIFARACERLGAANRADAVRLAVLSAA